MADCELSKDCKDKFDVMFGKLDAIHNRLFVDNGSPCIQSRLNRTERLISIVMWIVCVITAAIIAQTTKAVFTHLNEQHAEVQSLSSPVDVNIIAEQ